MAPDDALPEPPFNTPCVVYKPLTTYGGLELYAAELALAVDAPIYTATQTTDLEVYGESLHIEEFSNSSWFTRSIDRLPLGSLPAIIDYAAFPVPADHDAVITIGEVAKSVIHRPDQRRYHVLNMPPRWLFDQAPGRLDVHRPVDWLRSVYQTALRVHDVSTLARINDVIVPSETIARRLETYYHRRPSEVIYPPVRTDRYYSKSGDGYLLYLGRIARNKRVGELVDALSGTNYQVKIAGTGPLAPSLRAGSGGNVEWLGFVSDSRKRELLANCDAVLFNSDSEAFGIVPVEAFASGKPVVGVRDGFTKHQIIEGQNGVLYDRSPEAIRQAVSRMYDSSWDPEHIQHTAQKYDIERFRSAWRSVLGD